MVSYKALNTIFVSKIVNVKKHVRKIDVEERNFDNTDFSQNQACDDIYGGTF